MESNENVEVEIDNDLPPGYILIRKEDGQYTLLKMEPEEEEEVIEEVENMDAEGRGQENQEEDAFDGADHKNLITVSGSYMLPNEHLEELDIDVIPDIIEEELSPGSHMANEAQVEFVDASSNPEFGALSITVSKSSENKPKKSFTSAGSYWRGMQIPPELSRAEIEKFKSRHILQRLLEQVKRNRQKVEIYDKKNDELRKLIGNQRDQMVKMGFDTKDIAKFHTSKRKHRLKPKPLSPLIDKSHMIESERLEYQKKRLQDEYNYYRRSLKAILSSHRRYKKIFVENHEKLKKGPGPGRKLGVANFLPTTTLVGNPVLGKEEILSEDESLSELSDSLNPPKIFKCYHCRFSAATKSSLVPHVQKHLEAPKIYECPSCPFVTPKVTQFMEHMKSHPGVKAFTCDHCDFKTQHPSALKNHLSVHMAVKPYKCPMCPLRFGRSDHLRCHMKCHSSNKNYKCELCPFASKYSSGLSNHIRRMHKKLYEKRKREAQRDRELKEMKEEVSGSDYDDPGETTEIEVDENGKISYVLTINKRESEDVSDEENRPRVSQRRQVKKKVFEDYTDGEEFDEGLVNSEAVKDEDGNVVVEETYEGSEGEIVEEEEDRDETIVEDEPRTFSEDTDEPEDLPVRFKSTNRRSNKDLLSSYVIYQCAFCDFSCEMKNNLLDHLRTHMRLWNFSCKACNFEAMNPIDLQTHSEEHKNVGEFDCHYCDYSTDNKVKLKGHVEKRHPMGTPLACIHCDFITSQRMTMKNHMMTHKSRKMWQCTSCDYKAPFRSSLKRHLRKHTGERPYTCSHCDFTATQYSHLTRHLRRYHPDEPALLEHRPPSPFMPLF